MDRLSTLSFVTVVALLAACEGKAYNTGDPPPRTNGAKVQRSQAASPDGFCDVNATDQAGPVFRWPDLAKGSTAPGATEAWRWVNLWATWCKPCIAEMPRLAALRDKLVASGKHVELTFVSVDESDDDVAAFRKEHPEAPPSIRVASADQRNAWFHALGLPDGAIPLHVFVSPANRLRCARAGEVRDQDLGVVDQLLAQ